MAKLNDNRLRKVRLEEVARYLGCNPEKLRIALKHLAAVPSAIQYSEDAAVSINPAVRRKLPADLTPEEVASAALDAMAVEALNKIILDAYDRLDQAGGKGNYSLEEVVALVEAEKAAEKAARVEDIYQRMKAGYRLDCTMTSSEAKWLN